METTPGEKRGRSLHIKAFGAEVEIRGYDLIIVAVLGAVVAIGYSAYNSNTAIAAEHGKMLSNQTEMATIQKANAEKNQQKLDEIVYILTLSQPARDKLKLDMPRTLRDKSVATSSPRDRQ